MGMSSSPNIVNQALSRPSEFLRTHRVRISLWTAVIEGVLVVIGVLPHIVVYVLAVVAIAFWISAARSFKSGLARQAGWIFAASQALAVLVPIFLFIAKTIAIFAIAVAAVVALVYLFTDRNRA
jgi:hypothetical protein